MIKAIFLDMDGTLCDTEKADKVALHHLREAVYPIINDELVTKQFLQTYIDGIYRRLDQDLQDQLLPVLDERVFRLSLIRIILSGLSVTNITDQKIEALQNTFDDARKRAFDFYPGIKELLITWRSRFNLVVITNGPEFSQQLKINAVKLEKFVDHIIIGGQEKEEKPAASIFEKALSLCGIEAENAIHIGDKLSTDILGANNSAIQSVWIKHGQELDASEHIKPDFIISHPSDMEQLIKKLA